MTDINPIAPEKFKNEDGSLNADALMKSYSELEKKLGAMVSLPGEGSDDIVREKFYRAIGVPESHDDYPKNEMFGDESIRKTFREIGLTTPQVEKIYSMAEEFLSPLVKEIYQTGQDMNAMTELETMFGGKQKTIDTLHEIKAFGEKFLPADAFDTLCSTSQGIKAIHDMMMSQEPRVALGDSGHKNVTDDDLRKMMRDPKYWRDSDPEYVRKIESGFKKLYSEKN